MKIKNHYLNNLRLCIRIVKKENKKYFTLKCLCAAVLPLIAIILDYIMKWVIDCLSYNKTRITSYLFILLTLFFILKVLSMIITNIESYSEEMNKNGIRRYINRLIISKCNELDISIYDDPQSYNEILFVHSNYDSISSYIEAVFEIIFACFSCITIFILSMKKLYFYVLLMIIACIPAAVFKIRYIKKLFELSVNQMEDERKADYLTSLVLDKKFSQDVKQYGMGTGLLKRYDVIWRKLLLEKKEILKNNVKLSSIFLILPELVFLVIMMVIVNKIINNNMTIGDFSLYIGLLTQIWGNINRIIYDVDSVIEKNSQMDYLKNFIEKKSNIINGTRKIGKVESIRFENVSFKYPFSSEYTLKNMEFEVRMGESVAIVGKNGSGKSTLIKLLLRFYDVSSGNIYINDVNIKEYDVFDLRKCFGLYFQNNNNFAFTVGENVSLSNFENLDEELIVDALRLSGFYDIMNERNIGLDSYVTKLFNDQGIELSGGEYQKLALGRTIFCKTDWLIFDEPSSALDPKSEYDFFSKIRKLSHNKTMIYISHRLSNIDMSDKIFVIENGSIVESGEVSELINNKGKFYELYNYQKDNYTV